MPKKEELKEKSGKELAEVGINTVATLYTEFRTPGMAQTCFKTCSTLIGNLLKDPSNEKFRRVNMDNEAIKKRVTTLNGGLNILKGAGFVKSDEGNFLIIEKSNIDNLLLSTVIKMLQEKIIV
jgi:hypothetical protein